MAKVKHEYYLATLDNTIYDSTADFLEDIGDLKDIDRKYMKEIGICFYTDIPGADFSSAYCDTISRDVLSFKKLSELIDNYIYCYDDEIEQYLNDDDDDEIDEEYLEKTIEKIKGRYENLLNEELVVRRNLKTNKYSFVSTHDLEKCIQDIHNNEMICDEQTVNFELDKSEFDKIDNFIETIESLIEKDYAFITAYNSNEESYIINIFKENSYFHKNASTETEFTEDDFHNGFVFENGYENFKKFLLGSCLMFNVVSISIRVNVTNIEDVKDSDFSNFYQKVYGFGLMSNGEQIELNNLSAKDLLETYTINSETGKPIEPEKNVIYCSLDKNDYICGFDLL